MKIKFVGAIDHITGSCSWLKYSKTGTQFLVDCGMHQGHSAEELNAKSFPFNPSEIEFVLLTHAHIDHCGLIPKLYRHGFRGKVYATSATVKLAKIGLHDAAKIQPKNHLSVYDKADVEKINFISVDEDDANLIFCQPDKKHFFWRNNFYVSTNISVAFHRSSHILGAASITVNWKDESGDTYGWSGMCFSGDIGNNTKELSYLPLIKPNQYPFPSTKYLLVESTYGDKARDEKYKSSEARKKKLWEIIQKASKRGGKILIPVFSIHRSQEVLIDLIATIKTYASEVGETERCQWDILCQSPMITKVCKVYAEELKRQVKDRDAIEKSLYTSDSVLNYIKENSTEVFDFLFNQNYYKFNDTNKIDILSKKPKNYDEYDIIVASSGMCAAGPIKGYLDEYENDPSTTIILTGYQASPDGRKIQDYAKTENEKYAQVENMAGYYSGHADQNVLLDYIFNISGVSEDKVITPATVFINHGGSTIPKKVLKKAIEEQNNEKIRQRKIAKVVVAEKSDQWFNLTSGEFDEITNTDLANELQMIRQQLFDLSNSLNNIKLTISNLQKNKPS